MKLDLDIPAVSSSGGPSRLRANGAAASELERGA